MDMVTFLSIVVGLLIWFIFGALWLVTQTLGGRSGSRAAWWEHILMAPVFGLVYFLKIFAK
jgi:hypothetical protein